MGGRPWKTPVKRDSISGPLLEISLGKIPRKLTGQITWKTVVGILWWNTLWGTIVDKFLGSSCGKTPWANDLGELASRTLLQNYLEKLSW